MNDNRRPPDPPTACGGRVERRGICRVFCVEPHNILHVYVEPLISPIAFGYVELMAGWMAGRLDVQEGMAKGVE